MSNIKKQEDNKKNAAAILHQVNANMSLVFALSRIFLARKKRLSTREVQEKYMKDGKVQYVGYEDEGLTIEVHGVVLVQSHLDALSAVIEGIKYDQERGYYTTKISFYDLAKKLRINRRDAKELLVDLKDATLLIKSKNKSYHADIIKRGIYVNDENNNPLGVELLLGVIFVHYFFFFTPAIKFSQEMQNIIFQMNTGEAKAIVRYCFIKSFVYKEKIEENIFDILFPFQGVAGKVNKVVKSKIRKKIKKDIPFLNRLGIEIDGDVVKFENKEKEKIKAFINNNQKLLAFINETMDALEFESQNQAIH